MITYNQDNTKGVDYIEKYLRNKIKEIEKACNKIFENDCIDLLITINKEYYKHIKTIKNGIEDIKECLEKNKTL